MKKVLFLVLVIVGVVGPLGYAQERMVTQKDIDFLVEIQPSLNSIAEKLAKQKKPMSDSKEGCKDGCQNGCPSSCVQYSPAYKKELERLLAPYKISVDQFDAISKRIMTLYSLLSMDDLAAGMRQTITEGKNLLDPALINQLRSMADDQEEQQSSALSQYSQQEKELIRKNRPKLDELFSLTPPNIVDVK